MELSDLEEESVLDELKALELQEEDDHEEPNQRMYLFPMKTFNKLKLNLSFGGQSAVATTQPEKD